MAQWNGSSETGILRKKVPIENHDELLVFGYACKLFRDDEKAIFIDQGKHLIPWMGDEKLKIDRYDCRGALADLRKYEASKEGFDAMRWLGLSDKEINLEELCDKERYYSLEINEEEEEMYKEEEQKRKKTNAVQYSYDVPQNLNTKSDGIPTVPEEEEVEEEYIPSPILDVPVDIEIPKTVKEYARIEKTALFVCRQGLQMEILIKAKQSDNPQFGFLNQGDPLYKFYRHVLAAFKNGRYQGCEPRSKNKTDVSGDDMVQDSSSHYLHPSLTSNNPEPDPPTAVSIPQIPYKPSVNCAYSQLVNRIQGSQSDNQDSPKSTTMTIPDFGQMTYEQQQYYQYYYAQQYYEYYKQMALYQQGQGGNPGQFIPPQDFQNLDPNIQTYIQQMAYNQYLQQLQQASPSNSNSYAQIVTNVSKDNNPYAMNVPQLVQNLPLQADANAPVVYGPDPKPEEDVRKVTIVDKPTDKAEIMLKKPILSLAAYGSSSESGDDDDETSEEEPKEQLQKKEVYEVPSEETQIVIDKMAMYVSKNGEQFEEIVKAKGDPRFDFLNGTHEYNKYYKEKIKELKGEVTSFDEQKEKKEVKDVKKAKKEKKVIAPVSFSIKKAKEELTKEIKSALPLEESDEDEEEVTLITTAPVVATENSARKTPSSTPPSLVSVLLKYAENQKKTNKEIDDTITIIHEDNLNEKELKETNLKNNESQKIESSEGDDLILEMIELTRDIEDKQEKKAEDKIKDKLAAAAREKLAFISRDRALQLERKRKAAAFLKLKSDQINPKTNESQRPKLSLKEDSIEIIEIDLDDDDDTPEKKEPERHKSRSKHFEKKMGTKETRLSRDRSRSRDKEKRRLKKKSSRSKDKSRVKEKDKKRSECSEDDEDYKRKKDDERKERKKKSHKRKHSKSRHDSKNKKKSKKRHKKSESDTSDSTDNNSS